MSLHLYHYWHAAAGGRGEQIEWSSHVVCRRECLPCAVQSGLTLSVVVILCNLIAVLYTMAIILTVISKLNVITIVYNGTLTLAVIASYLIALSVLLLIP